MNELEEYKMLPEIVEVTNTYLQTNNIYETAQILEIEPEKVTYYLNKPEAKRYIDNVFLDQGYLNRHKLMSKMSEIIEKKFEELDEAEIGSSKDIADLIFMMHRMRKDYASESIPQQQATVNKTQINVGGNVDFGSNYNTLLERIVGAK